MSSSRTRYTLDAYHGGNWYARHQLWISEGGAGWLIPDGDDDTYLRLSQWGLDKAEEPPFLDRNERLYGLDRGAEYLAAFVRRR